MSKKIYYEVRLSTLYPDGSLIHSLYYFWDFSRISVFVSKERDMCKTSFVEDVHVDYIKPYYDDSFSGFSESDLYVVFVKCNNLVYELNGGD